VFDELMQPVLMLGLFGLVFGLILAYAARVFAVQVDPRLEAIEPLMPGANCGGCGYPGCSGYAAALCEGAPANLCPALKPEVRCRIAEILGVTVEETAPRIAVIRCDGDLSPARRKYDYVGEEACAVAVLLAEGPNPCRYGCVGMGSCVAACPFGAMRMRPGKPPEVDPEKCVACGKCVESCPKSLIALLPADGKVFVLCSSHDKGKAVKDICATGCIACGLCAKKCPVEAIAMADNLPVIDYAKCTSCGTCAEVCPQHTILFKGEKSVVAAAAAAKE